MIGADKHTDILTDTGTQPALDVSESELLGSHLSNHELEAELRRKAEDIAQHGGAPQKKVDQLSLAAAQSALHELRVHQIELQMQNEELRRTQVELEAARARYFDLYDLAPVGYCVVSEHGQIRQANLTATTLLGITRGALVKQPISRFIFKEDQDIYYLCRKKLLATGDPQSCDLRMVTKEGTQFWARLTNTLTRDAMGTPTLRVTLADITERVQLLEALAGNNIELKHAKLLAEQANLAKSAFLSNMSHELRSPLNAILGFAQLLQSDGTIQTATQKENTDEIIKAGWYLLDMINELLDLPMIESGQLRLTLEPMSLEEALLDCYAMMAPLAQQHKVSLHFPRFETPCFINANPKRVKQVLVNLISNAIKYNREGGSVDVTYALQSTERIRVSVKDSGNGLSSEQLSHLYELFNRLGQEDGGEEGSGIGLVTVKRLVELMGGTIGAESTVGVGSTFYVEFLQSGTLQ